MVGKGTIRVRNKRISRDHPDYSIVNIGQNTLKSPRDSRRLVTQIPVRNHQLTMVWKTLKRIIIIIIIIIMSIEFFLKKLCKLRVTIIHTYCRWSIWNSLQRLEKGTKLQ